jgi:hypothetical protein
LNRFTNNASPTNFLNNSFSDKSGEGLNSSFEKNIRRNSIVEKQNIMRRSNNISVISSDFANQKQAKIFHGTHGPGGFAGNSLKNGAFSSSIKISNHDNELNNVSKIVLMKIHLIQVRKIEIEITITNIIRYKVIMIGKVEQ